MRLLTVVFAVSCWLVALVSRTFPPRRRETGRRIRPVQFLLVAVTRVAPRAKPFLQKALIRAGYHLLSSRNRDDTSTFMNYGYSPVDQSDFDLTLQAADKADMYSIQLYWRVVGDVELRDKDVLEVGCGRGGGSSFIKRYLFPRNMTGVDLSGEAIKFCRRRYKSEGLGFRQGDAENLPFPAASFDAVVNVESSHNYPSVERFFGEVQRVLRPHGYFLFADIRPQRDVDLMLEQLERAGLTLIVQERITTNVVRALDQDSERRRSIVKRNVPPFLHKVLEEFLGVAGTPVYQALCSQELEYVRFVLRKPGSEQSVGSERAGRK